MTKIFVKLLDEGTDAWRPVAAEAVSEAVFRISMQAIPDEEIWEFQPGEIVAVEMRGDARIAVRRVSV